MKNIKKFKNFIKEELSPDTIDKAINTAYDKGNDQQAERIFNLSGIDEFKNKKLPTLGTIVNISPNTQGNQIGFTLKLEDGDTMYSEDGDVIIDYSKNMDLLSLFKGWTNYVPFMPKAKFANDKWIEKNFLLAAGNGAPETDMKPMVINREDARILLQIIKKVNPETKINPGSFLRRENYGQSGIQ